MTSLDHEARQVFAELEMTSAGRIYSYEPIGSKGGFSSSVPKSGDANPPHVHWRREYEAQSFDSGRRRVIDLARAELDALRVRRLPEGFMETPEPPVERSSRLLRAGEGIPLQEAAHLLNCAPSELLKLRKADGRDGQHGRMIPDTSGEKRDQARALLGKLSTRDIAKRLGVHQTQIMRWSRDA